MRKVLLQPDYTIDCFPNFNSNMEFERHRWYSFKEGYSASLVRRAISENKIGNRNKAINILDPFSGSGTTALVAAENAYNSIAIEVNPFLVFVGEAKCYNTKKSESVLLDEVKAILNVRPHEIESPLEEVSTFTYRPELEKWLYNRSVLRGFESIKQSIYQVADGFPPFMLALYSALTDCSNAKRDGKCLRYKKDWKSAGYSSLELREKFEFYARQVIRDLMVLPLGKSKQEFLNESALSALSSDTIVRRKYDLIVFSPPYLNSFDYTDVYRPELFLGGYVSSSSELRELRSHTLRSHVQYNWETYGTCSSKHVEKIVCALEARISDLWNKRIPKMVSSYFADMEEIFKQLFVVAQKGASMWIVISTSAYAGIEIPVDTILAELARMSGWKLEGVHTLRNIRSASQHSLRLQNSGNVRLRESLVRLSKI